MTAFLGVAAAALLVLAGIHGYIALRMWQCVHHLRPQFPFWGAAAVLLLSMVLMMAGFMRSQLPAGAEIRHALGVFSSWWMGAFVYLLLFCLLTDAVLLLIRIVGILPWRMPSSVRFVSGLLTAVLTLTTVLGGAWHADRPKRVDYHVQLDGYEAPGEMNIVMISDLHLGAVRSERRLERIVQEINAASPDLILIAGDFFDSDYGAIRDPERASELLLGLHSTYGVYACLGNHDAGGTFEKMTAFLERSGIQLLADESVVIAEKLVLAGRLDGSPIGSFGGMKRRELSGILPEKAQKLPVVVLDHNPAHAQEYHQEADLVLCGHTHKGQIFPGSLITNSMYTVDYGMYRHDEESPYVIVTSGVGTWGPPIRVGTDSEINCIRLMWQTILPSSLEA